MPITYVVDRTCGQVRTTVTGPITVQDILDHFERVHREKNLDLAELIDAREAGQPFLSAADIWSAARLIRDIKALPPLGPRAILVGNATTYQLACIFATSLTGYISVNVFRNRHTAEDWLEWRSLFNHRMVTAQSNHRPRPDHPHRTPPPARA